MDRKWKNLLYPWIGAANTIKISTLQKVIGIQCDPNQNTGDIFLRFRKKKDT